MQAKIIKRTVDGIAPQATDLFVWDSGDGAVKGFGLKVTPAGRKIYIFQYRIGGRGSATRRYTIGEHGPWTPDKARVRAEDLGRLISKNIDPLSQEREELATKKALAIESERSKDRSFSVFAERYIKRRVAGLDSGKQIESTLRKRFMTAWEGYDIAKITREDVGKVLDKIVDEGKPSAAWNALRAVRPLFNYALERGLIAVNPASRIRPDVIEASRDRVLTDKELVEIWQATSEMAYPFGSMVRLLMLTGQRRNEVAEMQWAELDLAAGLWTIPGERTKNEKGHIIHLSPQSLKIMGDLPKLSEKFVFSTNGEAPVSGFSKAKDRLDGLIAKARNIASIEGAMPDWTLHDLRRTLATGLADMGIAPYIAEKILNHNPKALGGVAGIYNRHEYLAERKAAIEAWGRRIEGIVEGTGGSNVLPFLAIERPA
ncbi:MAG: tyrosine-type recombinase/integrase [Alphaproteobacteria bacterium]|nr:tyrosine-type recombinase/integrase [Alphaproteobacteria bacterium]